MLFPTAFLFFSLMVSDNIRFPIWGPNNLALCSPIACTLLFSLLEYFSSSHFYLINWFYSLIQHWNLTVVLRWKKFPYSLHSESSTIQIVQCSCRLDPILWFVQLYSIRNSLFHGYLTLGITVISSIFSLNFCLKWKSSLSFTLLPRSTSSHRLHLIY